MVSPIWADRMAHVLHSATSVLYVPIYYQCQNEVTKHNFVCAALAIENLTAGPGNVSECSSLRVSTVKIRISLQ